MKNCYAIFQILRNFLTEIPRIFALLPIMKNCSAIFQMLRNCYRNSSHLHSLTLYLRKCKAFPRLLGKRQRRFPSHRIKKTPGMRFSRLDCNLEIRTVRTHGVQSTSRSRACRLNPLGYPGTNKFFLRKNL